MQEGRPWSAALKWLAVLGPFFFLSYCLSNSFSSHRANVPSVMFGWEQRMPFIPWTIVPYWTSDFLYVLSLLICTTRRELDLHAKRLLALQVISVACFLVFPLQCAFSRPETHGVFGWLFTVLLGFDKPFNQAPSLHVSLAVILWSRFAPHLTGFWRHAMTGWLGLIVLSTMTTYQHQFLDLPTGVLAGLLTIALVPDRELAPGAERKAQRMRLATIYMSGAVLALATAIKLGGYGWTLAWVVAALLMVAIAYATDRPGILRQPLIRLVVAPYTAGAWINSRWWTRAQEPAQEIADGVWLGRAPFKATKFASVVNLAAELQVPGRQIPMLDLVTPTEQQLREAASAIEEFGSQRPTLVCCALGYSRSASAVAAWLVATGRAESTAEAVARIRVARPHVVLESTQPQFDGVAVARRV